MRIDRVELRRFGHFVDTRVELGHPVGGLRFVVGPNEAGKSTLRSAVRAALFGFEGRTVAGRPAASSAVALHLVNDASDALVVQRQGLGAPRDADGRPIDAERLAAWVPLSREAYDRLYCLGHDELRRYGMELLQSGADLGRIVFGAALGGTHVQWIGSELASQVEALFARGARSRKLNKAVDELQSLDTQLRSITVSADAWDALRAQIKATEERLASLATRQRALVGETARLERIRRTANARGVLREHREALERCLAEGPAPDAGTTTRIASLLEAVSASAASIEAHRGSISTLQGRLAGIGTDRAALDRASEITALHQELSGYREATDRVRRFELDPAASHALPHADRLQAVLTDDSSIRAVVVGLDALDADNAAARAKLVERMKQLGLASVRSEDVAVLAVPTEAEIESAREGAAGRAARRGSIQAALDRVQQDITAVEARLRAALAGGAPLPSDEEIALARSERDGSWGALRAWFVSESPPPGVGHDRAGLAAQVQGGIEHADALVDRVRADTSRAAHIHALERQLEAARSEQAQWRADLEALEVEDRAALEAWRALWDGVPVRVGSPSEMSAWRRDWSELCQDVAAVAATIAHADERRAQIAEARQRLAAALVASGHAPATDAGVLALLDAAEARVEREQARRAGEVEATEARARIERVDTQMADLVTLLPASDRRPGARAIDALHELLNRQSRDHEARSALAEQIREASDALERERERHERLEASAREEAQVLGVGVEQLPEVLARARAAAELRRKIDDRKEQLLDAGDGLSLEALRAEAEAAGDLDAVAARLEEIAREEADLDSERTEATKRLAELQAEFRLIAGGDEAAATHEAQARALSRIENVLEEIAVLTLAASLLERVVEAARSTGRGPLIERAGHYFALLTDGAFDRLDLELHGEQAFPVAVRADGSRLYPDALSDGTLDQLWLAWRLAGVEHHIDQMGPVPLMVDDVLVNFDDARAGSALRAVASLAERTQVLVLTHHPHLVDIARERLGRDRVVVAALEAGSGGALAVTQVVSAEHALGRAPVPAPVAPRGSVVGARVESSGSRNAAVDDLRAAIDAEWRGRAELVERSGVAERDWSAGIKALLAEGSVEQRGAKRGAKYRRAGSTDA